MSSPTRAEAIAELEERVRDTLYHELPELGQIDLDVVNYTASRISHTILRDGDDDKGVSAVSYTHLTLPTIYSV